MSQTLAGAVTQMMETLSELSDNCKGPSWHIGLCYQFDDCEDLQERLECIYMRSSL
jgi:hypothetical protein